MGSMKQTPTRGSETRARIIEAALETVSEEGFAEATARAIARRGGFNQALIFYHFGSLANLLLEAFAETSATQVAKYRDAAADVSSLSDLVEIARRLHADDLESGSVAAVTQLMAAATDPKEKRAILDRFEEWIRLVQETLERVSSRMPVASVVPAREAAYAIAAMFLGIELMAHLDPQRSEAPAVFDMMVNMTLLIDQLAPQLFPPT
jgi:AcrR family transcriptional regulator